MEFAAASPRTAGTPLDRMLIAAVYGYNSPASGTHKARSQQLWSKIQARINAFRQKHPTGSVLLGGDLNAAKSAHLDTDRPNTSPADTEVPAIETV